MVCWMKEVRPQQPDEDGEKTEWCLLRSCRSYCHSESDRHVLASRLNRVSTSMVVEESTESMAVASGGDWLALQGRCRYGHQRNLSGEPSRYPHECRSIG